MKKLDLNIVRRIHRIEESTFTEDDIKLLLIEIRERLEREKILSEICHFVAHPKRDKGISHKKIDVRYAKIKFSEQQKRKELTDEFFQNNRDKPDRFFTDAMLGYIKTNKIEKHIFDLLILAGLDDLQNHLFVKYYGLNKKRVKQLIFDSYRIKDDHYVIKNNLPRNKFLLIDDLLKFIRGTITGKPAFNKGDIQGDLIRVLKRLSLELNYEINVGSITKNMDDVILTILSLMHDAQFELFDGEIGRAFLSIHPRGDEYEMCLMGESGRLSLPLIGTDLDARRYIKLADLNQTSYGLKEIPWTSIARDKEGKIYLVEPTIF